MPSGMGAMLIAKRSNTESIEFWGYRKSICDVVCGPRESSNIVESMSKNSELALVRASISRVLYHALHPI